MHRPHRDRDNRRVSRRKRRCMAEPVPAPVKSDAQQAVEYAGDLLRFLGNALSLGSFFR